MKKPEAYPLWYVEDFFILSDEDVAKKGPPNRPLFTQVSIPKALAIYQILQWL